MWGSELSGHFRSYPVISDHISMWSHQTKWCHLGIMEIWGLDAMDCIMLMSPDKEQEPWQSESVVHQDQLRHLTFNAASVVHLEVYFWFTFESVSCSKASTKDVLMLQLGHGPLCFGYTLKFLSAFAWRRLAGYACVLFFCPRCSALPGHGGNYHFISA